jgi:acyl-coenzyme A synthetase/AMP-(fatty) acid ligase
MDNNIILNFSGSETDYAILNVVDKLRNMENITFTTSGTTCTPKQYVHTYVDLIKNIKVADTYKDVIWALTYDYTKMAGVQVLLQALLNGSNIVNLIGYTNSEIVDIINKYQVTHISATPTFYRLLQTGDNQIPSILQVTIGGESVASDVINHVRKIFPNANIKNIYASTEFGTIMASDSEYFTITDRIRNKVNIIDNILYIYTGSEWQCTDDVVEFISQDTFKIVGRTNTMINVGGIKVNPIRIEGIINSLDYVTASYVYSKHNSVLGNIVAANISVNVPTEINSIRNDLRDMLSKYEMPMQIQIVDVIHTNTTGKINRI